ncbi:MAG: metal-sensing transcriptional repressor [Candidatus Peribacteraceae bacterium]|nr:metal-sensing transcriptional repressor [Candidatus Peribacteraceae bacterium]
MADDCTNVLKHLNRIQGQIDALKGYISEQRSCDDVAHLLKSITTSFASARTEIVEQMLLQNAGVRALPSRDRAEMRTILSVLKK